MAVCAISPVPTRRLGTPHMGVLDRQSLRGEVRNRKLGKERLAMRDRRHLTRPAATERRRPDRGMRDTPGRSRTARRPARPAAALQLLDRLSDLAHGLGRLLLFVVLVPLLLLRLLLRPAELVARIREAPTRLRATAKRLRLESRDPGTFAGKSAETARLATWFLQEELADMRDGIPTVEVVRADLRTGSTTVLDQVAHVVGLRETGDGVPVGARLSAALATGVILGVVGIGLFVAVFNGIEELKTSEHLALQSVTVVGLERVAEEAVLAALGAKLGDNMLELESATLGGAILAFPWVDSVEVRRDIPGRAIEVRVLEHRAALMLVGETLRLVDDRGRVFKDWEAGEPWDLPLLTANDGGELREETRKLALEVLHAIGAGRALGDDAISEIRWDDESGFSVVTRRGLPVRLGRRDFGARLDRVERAVGAGRLPLDAVASVDAGLRDRIVAVPREAPRARRAVKKVIETQPVPRRDRARLLHLRRIGGAATEALFSDDPSAEL
jgi:cell division septal protein FtsQ